MRFTLLVPIVLLAACQQPHPEVLRAALARLPESAPSPADNPTTAKKVELGRLLFWDPILSGHEDVACATCHHPDFGYGDGLALSIGVGGKGLGPTRHIAPHLPLVPRNSPTVLNTGFNGWVDGAQPPDPEDAPMFWDSREASLEAQALGPIESDLEMRGEAYPMDEAVDRVVQRLAQIPEYVSLFADAFAEEPAAAVSAKNLGRAIAAFERHLSKPNSAYDRWLAGDDAALSPSQRRGLDAFHDVGCANCHSGPMFSDFRLHRLGVPDPPGMADHGDGNGRFRTPTLRNIALTAPYMHNGRFDSLGDVFEFYEDIGGDGDGGLVAGAPLSPQLDGLDLEEEDMADIEAFLRALTDDFDRAAPTRVPSGLPPGGDIEG